MNEYEAMRKAVYSIVNFLFISIFIIQVYVIIEEYQHPHEISTSQHHEKLEACFILILQLSYLNTVKERNVSFSRILTYQYYEYVSALGLK